MYLVFVTVAANHVEVVGVYSVVVVVVVVVVVFIKSAHQAIMLTNI